MSPLLTWVEVVDDDGRPSRPANVAGCWADPEGAVDVAGVEGLGTLPSGKRWILRRSPGLPAP